MNQTLPFITISCRADNHKLWHFLREFSPTKAQLYTTRNDFFSI